MDQTKMDDILQAYADLQKAMETLVAQLRKAEKQIYALEEGLTAFAAPRWAT